MEPIDIEKIPIMVWKAEDAPRAYRDLRSDLSDVDWIAVVPPSYRNTWIAWLDSDGFSPASGRKVMLPDGFGVFFGRHA